MCNFLNPDNCSAPSYLVLTRDDANNWKMVHAVILTWVTGKAVQVRTIGCHAQSGYPIIDGAKLIK